MKNKIMKNKLFLTESEKSRISGLHRMAIATESKNTLNEATLQDIQNLLSKKLGPEVLGPKGADGRLGTFTLNAIYSALTQTQVDPAKVDPAKLDPAKVDPAKVDPAKVDPAQAKFELKANMVGKGLYGDEAEGKTVNVVSVTPINCDLTEVLFKSTNPSAKYPNTYGYFKTSEGLTGPAAERKEVNFRRLGSGVKSNNPCKEFPTFDNFGTLTFS